jgi:branched-chain amino acid transport system ATP-binding protein
MEAMLEIVDVITAYGKIEALKGVSLSANRGRITCLLGPNGAGKTTLMMTVAGALRVRGVGMSIKWGDLVTLWQPSGRRQRCRTGPREPAGVPQIVCVRTCSRARPANAGSPPTSSGYTAPIDRLGELWIAAFLGFVTWYGPMLMSRPRVLLMDEPSLGLAPIVVKEIFGIIAELNREGVTIFLVEQNAHLALQVAHHFYLMEQGRVTFSGNPGELAEDEVIKRAYLGTRRSAG